MPATADAPPTWDELTADPRYANLTGGERMRVLEQWRADVQAHLGDGYDAQSAEPYVQAQRDKIAAEGQGKLSTGLRSGVVGMGNVALGAVQGLGGFMQDAGDAIDKYTGLPIGRVITDNLPGGMFYKAAAPIAKDIAAENERVYAPDRELNPKSATVGSGVGQAIGMVPAALTGGTGAVLTLAGTQGYAQGRDTAEEIGVENPLGKLAMGTAFGAAETLTERIGGIGGGPLKEGAKAMINRIAGKGIKTILAESGEEALTGAIEDTITAGAAKLVEDPNRPGYTTTGEKIDTYLPTSAEWWNRRGHEALGGAAGGALFAGAAKLGGGHEATPPPLPTENRLPVAGDRDRTGKMIKAVQDMGNGNLQVNYEDGSASSGKAILFQPLSANVTDGSLTQAPGSYPAKQVPGDAGSTPAVGASLSPLTQAERAELTRLQYSDNLQGADYQRFSELTDRDKANQGRTVEAIFEGENGAQHIAFTDGSYETRAPSLAESPTVDGEPSPENLSPEQQAQIDAAMQAGPKSLMDVATRGGQIDAPRLQFSLSPGAVHRAVARQTGFKRGAAVNSTALPDIVNAYRLGPQEATVTEEPEFRAHPDFHTVHRVENKDGGKAWIMHGRDGTVWVNTAEQRSSKPQPSQGADLVYQAAMTYAHNNGLQFRPDPDGVSAIARKRRISQMLSSALRHGTTEHLLPRGLDHQNQPFEEVPGWKYEASPEASAHNIDALARAEYEWVRDEAKKQGVDITRLRWDPADDTVHDDLRKARLSETSLNDILRRLDPERTGIGEATLSRALVTQRAIRPDAARQRGGIRAAAHAADRGGEDAANDSPLWHVLQRRSLYYSIRTVDGPRLSERVADTRATAASAAEMLNRQLPGVVGAKLTMVSNPAELLTSGYAAENTFTAEEQAQMLDAEGFFDTRTGHTIIFTDHIEVRPGESERAAVARVILHERVGHDGFNALHQNDAIFREKWESLASNIDATELDAIAHDYPHLAGDRNQLALEWFARQVEARVHLQEGSLAQRLWIAIKGFARRLKDMFGKSSFDEEAQLMELITKAREAAQNGTAVPTTAEGLRLQFSMRERLWHKEGEPFKVRALGLQTLRTGSPLPASLHEVMRSTQADKSALDNAFARVASMLDVGAKEAARRTGQPMTAIYDRINAALDGTPGAMAVLQVTDPALAEATRRGRNMLDDMSQLIANTLPTNSPARLAIIGNMGHWMRRSFQVFDAAAGWNYDTLRAAAEAGKPLNGEDARKIMKDAAAYLVQQDPSLANQRDANGLPRKDTDLSATFDELLNRDTWTTSLVPGGASPRKNVTSLVKRKDMAPELRRLMGEHTNPLNRFATSASFQTQFAAKHKGLEAMRQIILTSGMGSTTRTDTFNKQMADNEGWNPLNGIYVNKELQAALQSVSTIDQAGAGHFADKCWKLLKSLTANAKMNNVPLNPKSTVTNIIGGAVATLQTGDLYAPDFVNRWVNAWKASRDGAVTTKEMQDITSVGLRDAEAQLRQELIANGVLDSNLTLEEFRAGNAEYLIKIFGDDPSFQKGANAALGAVHGAAIGNALGRIGGTAGQLGGMAAGAAAGAVIGGKNLIAFNQFLAKWTIGKSDALFKITGYFAQLRTAQLAGVANPQAWAAERVRNTYPTYDKVPAWLRTLSLTPLASNFVAFNYEVPRNAIWNLRYGLRDIHSPNAELRKSAARRLAGAAMVFGGLALGVSSGGVAALMGWAPPDDEKKRIFKEWLSADYERDSTLTFTNWDSEGVTYFNHAYLVPQVVWTDFVRLAASDAAEGDWDSAIFGSMGRLLRMYGYGNNMATTMIEAYNNRDRFGRKITSDGKPEDSTLERIEQYAQRADHVAGTYTDPGYARFAVEYLRAASINGDSAAIERLNDGALGLRSRHVTWDKAAKTATYKFRDQLQAVRDTLDDELNPKKATFATNRQASVERANAALARIAADLAKFERDMSSLPMPRSALQEAKRAAGIGNGVKALALDPSGTKAVTTKQVLTPVPR